MERILVVRFSSFGDMVLLSALLEEIRNRHPRAELWLLTKTEYLPLYQHDPRVDRLLGFGSGLAELLRLRRDLARVGFDHILDAHGSLRSRILCAGWGRARRRRIAKDTLARLLFVRTGRRSPALERHQVGRYLALVDAEGEAVRPRLQLGEADRLEADELIGPEDATPWLAIAPGARHATKRWPLDRYIELGSRFLQRGAGRLVLVGSPGESAMCDELAERLPGEIPVAAGRLSVRGSAAVLARARMLVCNDSGLMHVAEAVGTPVLAIFGPTSRELGYFPLDPHSHVLENHPPCRPCSRNGAVPCRLEETICLTHTTVERAWAALETQWS